MALDMQFGKEPYYQRLRESKRTPEARAAFGAMSRATAGKRRPPSHVAEQRNELGHCRAQLTQRLKDLHARYGGIPTNDELVLNGLSPSSVCLAFSLPTMTEVMKLLELTPSLKRMAAGEKGYSREYLIEVLRDFWAKYGRLPGRAHIRMGLIPREGAFMRQFGSMPAAYEAAGLARVSGRSPYTREMLIAKLQEFYMEHGYAPKLSRKYGYGRGGGLPPGLPTHRIFKRVFGSMAAAREAAGLGRVKGEAA